MQSKSGLYRYTILVQIFAGEIFGYVIVRIKMSFKTIIYSFHQTQHECESIVITEGLHWQLFEAASQEAPASHTLSASGLSVGRSHLDPCTVQQEHSEGE